MDVPRMQEKGQRKTSAARAPTMEVYEGPLSSGNIRYLGDELRDMLAQIRHNLTVCPLGPDQDIHAEVLKRLDKIREGRGRHFTRLPFWMRHVRRRLRSKGQRRDAPQRRGGGAAAAHRGRRAVRTCAAARPESDLTARAAARRRAVPL